MSSGAGCKARRTLGEADRTHPRRVVGLAGGRALGLLPVTIQVVACPGVAVVETSTEARVRTRRFVVHTDRDACVDHARAVQRAHLAVNVARVAAMGQLEKPLAGTDVEVVVAKGSANRGRHAGPPNPNGSATCRGPTQTNGSAGCRLPAGSAPRAAPTQAKGPTGCRPPVPSYARRNPVFSARMIPSRKIASGKKKRNPCRNADCELEALAHNEQRWRQ